MKSLIFSFLWKFLPVKKSSFRHQKSHSERMAENENLSNSSSNSSREDMHFFEGVEKLLEIWFEPNPSNKNADLRKIPRSMWDALLKTVRCEIISFTRNEQIDAYVLSESSMFVSKRRWILKTCGTTTPLQCLEPMLRLASEIAGYKEIEDLFYSRKNFKRPELQVSPHRGFEEEVAFLDSFFEDGRAYSLGAINRDCWHLYTLSRGGGGSDNKQLLNNIKNNNNQATNGGLSPLAEMDIIESLQIPDPDQTIEILMTDLDPKVMAVFTKDVCNTAMEATQKSGIHKLIPGMVIDDYLFDPCGYSMNGVSKSGCYMTIHITPEPDFSYVSFESNVASSSYGDLIARVIDTFQPGKFIVTVFANKTSPAVNASREIERLAHIDQWKRRDIQFSRFASYDFTYAQYCKYPS